MTDLRPARPDWRKARILPVAPETVEVLGSRVKATDAMWTGLDLSRAIIREQSTIMLAVVGSAEAPADHHLDVPWCHPDDQPEGWSDGMMYRVRPRRQGWRFVKEGEQWQMIRK